MKKVKKFLIGNIKTLIAFVLGGIICGGITTVVAYSIASSNVSYSNATSGSSATNVQMAFEDLSIRVKGQNECKIGFTKQNETSTGYSCNK